MVDFISRWAWNIVGFFLLLFIVMIVLILGKSYEVIDFETRTNQFTERIMYYADADGLLELSDFSSTHLGEVIGGIEEDSEIFSARVRVKSLDGGNSTTTYYAKDTFDLQLPASQVEKTKYELKIARRLIYLDDLKQNVQITFEYIYKREKESS